MQQSSKFGFILGSYFWNIPGEEGAFEDWKGGIAVFSGTACECGGVRLTLVAVVLSFVCTWISW